MKKYLILGGSVISPHDRDVHYISPDKLIRLYGLDPKECTTSSIGYRGLIVLGPRRHGDYREHLTEVQELRSR